MNTKKFQRKTEDFTCGHCGAKVKGNGYTNHCPRCLWSKHVDINPGDRLAECGGMMRPQSIELKAGKYRMLHVCEKCGHQKINDTAPEDDFEMILKIAEQASNTQKKLYK